MIELSILDLLYLVLTFFLVVIGTLLTLILLRVFKILAVGVELTNYYWQIKKLITYYSYVPYVVKDKIFNIFIHNYTEGKPASYDDTKGKDPIL